MSSRTTAAVREDARELAVLTQAYNPCYTPPPAHDDSEIDLHMREVAAHCILSGHPEEWHAWASRHGLDHLNTDLAFHLRGTVLLHEGDLVTAEALLHHALELRELAGHPGRRASTRVNLAEIALRRGRHEEAWERLHEALELDPELPIIHINRHCLADVAGMPAWHEAARAALEHHLPNWREDTILAAGLEAYRMHYTSLA